jgi:hypothetical protein
MSAHLETVLESTFGIKPMKPHLEITEENMAALEAFVATHSEPIVMVNLMQVRATACYEDAALNPCSGYEAFAQYTQDSSKVRQQAGAELIWSRHTNADRPKRKNLGPGRAGQVSQRGGLYRDDCNQRVRSSKSAQARRAVRLEIDHDN